MNDQHTQYSYIERDLNQLADVESQLDLLVLLRDEMIESVIPSEVQDRINDIGEEFAGKIAAATLNVNQLTKDIKENVIDLGITVKGEFKMATWNKGRTSWDTKALNGYAAAHPSINELRKVGNPTCSIRNVK